MYGIPTYQLLRDDLCTIDVQKVEQSVLVCRRLIAAEYLYLVNVAFNGSDDLFLGNFGSWLHS